jgi:hypothetical protein
MRQTGARWISTSCRVLVILLLFGASAGVVVGAPQKSQGIRTVGVISAFSDTFHVQKIGLMVFGNELKEFPIGSWGVDDLVTGKVRSLLGKRYDVRPVTYKKAGIAAARESWGRFGEELRPHISTRGLDAYIVIRSAGSQYMNTNQGLSGFGIVEHAGLHYFLFALYHIRLVDGRDLSLLDSASVYLPGYAPPFSGPIRGPHQKVDQSWWPTTLAAASNPRLKAGVIDLIDKSLPDALKRMQLVE